MEPHNLKKATWTSCRPRAHQILDAMSPPAALKAICSMNIFVEQYRNTVDTL